MVVEAAAAAASGFGEYRLLRTVPPWGVPGLHEPDVPQLLREDCRRACATSAAAESEAAAATESAARLPLKATLTAAIAATLTATAIAAAIAAAYPAPASARPALAIAATLPTSSGR